MFRKCELCGSNVEIKFKNLDKNSKLYKIEDFLKEIDDGSLIDYDGQGYYSLKNKMSDFKFNVKDYKWFNTYDKRFTHISWFNR